MVRMCEVRVCVVCGLWFKLNEERLSIDYSTKIER